MGFYQGKNGNVVLAVDSEVLATTMTPVIVIPVAQWRRLVHLILHEESDTREEFDKVEAEVRAIIASVEVK